MATSKQKIVLLHGTLGTAQDLKPLVDFLNEREFEALTFNFSGHGNGAAWPDQFRIDLFAHDLEKFLVYHQLKNVPVFGYSLGGYVALYHKVNFENSPLSSIITYGTKFNWSESGVNKELPMLNPDHLSEKFPQFAESLREKHGERWKSILRSTAHMMQNLQKLDGLTKEDLNELNAPVTLILGDLDRRVTTEETHLSASWIPHCQVKTLTHSKHELERANLKELAQTIYDILN